MLEYKITKIINAGLYTKDGEKVINLIKAALKGVFESLVIKNEEKDDK